MDFNEIKKRLDDFCDYLDIMPSGKLKGVLSRYFIGYCEAVKLLQYYEFLNKKR